MTGHRPDQPGPKDPADSASRSAGADVSTDEFATALKLIVKRLEGQDDEAETPPDGSDSNRDSAAVPPTAVLNSAPQPALSEPLWTGLSDSGSDEPEPTSPLAGGTDTFPDTTRDTDSADGARLAGTTTAADLWPAPSAFPDETTMAPEAPAASEDPLFAEAPARDTEPLFSEPPAPPQPIAEDPIFKDQTAAADPLFSPAPESADRAREPLFEDSSARKDPLFVETPAQGAQDPLFAEKPSHPKPSAFTVESTTAPIGGQPSEPSPAARAYEPTVTDPLAELRNREDAPTIGPAMPAPEPSQEWGTTTAPSAPDPFAADTLVESGQAAGTADAASGLDYPEPVGQVAEAPPSNAAETTSSNTLGGLGGAPNDPFSAASRPAFEDERSNALFGDAPSLAEQHAPGSSLGPIGAEAEDFGKDGTPQRKDEALIGQTIGDADLTATRDLGDDTDSTVELDQILPPLDPETGSLEKATTPPRPRRPLRVGAAAFWVLILAILGGIGYWGFQTRDQTAALGAWAQAQYGLPTGQLAALLTTGPDSAPPVSAPDATTEPTAPKQELAALPPAAEQTPVAEPPTPAPEPAATQPAAMPKPAPAQPPAAVAPPAAAEPTPPSAPVQRPAPVASPPPASTGSQPVTVAATTPPRLPDHLAPLPTDVSPQIRSLADRALSGDPLAQHDLANQYAVGETVAQSNSYAAYWYRLASDAGIANAQYNLGVLTARGLGVRKELEAAFLLFLTAAEAGHADAQTAVGLAYMYGSGVRQDRLRAASWFQAASTNGRPRGAFHLGQLFELGLDEAPDLAAAAGWYRIAADAGFLPGKEALERLTAAIRPTPAPTPVPSTAAAPATTPPLVPPSTGPAPAAPSELVREVQQMLNALGYDAGTEDGVNGGKTRLAIMAFQRSQGLYVTGEANRGTHELLRVVSGL